MHNSCCHSSFLFHVSPQILLPRSQQFLNSSYSCSPVYICTYIYVYLCTEWVAIKGKKGKESTRRCAKFCTRAAIALVMSTSRDASAWSAALPKMTDDATSDLSQPYAFFSDKVTHIPSYVGWNVATRSEVSSLLYLARVRPHLV